MPTQVITSPSTPPTNSIPWHTLEQKEIIAHFEVNPEIGFSQTKVDQLLLDYGANELLDKGVKPPLKIFWEQLTAVMVLILLAAAALSLFLSKFLEAGSILAIVILFTILGFVQEYRAAKAIAALKKLAVPAVRVFRDGKLVEISARFLVPGDIILLETGNLLPADCRIIESFNLRIQEAALTGESEPVEKTTSALANADLPLADRLNMGYMGTLVTYGRGKALVVETGMRTELGKIASLIQSVKEELTPLQQKLDKVGKQLALGGVAVALLIMVLGLLTGEELTKMLLTAIGVAVAVIPEGLPAVVTITLALGAQRMLKRNALIRKLPAVETLGSVTVICSDKTGTLTENRMVVQIIDVAGHRLEVAKQAIASQQPVGVTMLLAAVTLCNDAHLQTAENSENSGIIGDPTEGALLLAALQGGMVNDELLDSMPRIGELPFDSSRKRMTTVHHFPDKLLPKEVLKVWQAIPQNRYLAFTKGAVDYLLKVSSHVWLENAVKPMDSEIRQRIQVAGDALSASGMRVLGVAYRHINHTDIKEEDESGLIFIGLVGMIDPPREEVREAVTRCKTAGILPVMITGDHPLTANYIARDLGITTETTVLTGDELSKMNEQQLNEAVENVSVFARVAPEHKLRIVQALRNKGHIVAMTGDGVNDAPALKKADIGVAMGITGTDVAKEASDMVLRDDNFATIVAAVEEGRVIYDNLRRFVMFSVAGNIGKVAVMLFWPLPFALSGLKVETTVALLPLQLLWLNLMTDGLLGLSMGMEKAEKNVMNRPPNSPDSGIFSGGMGLRVSWIGVVIGLIALVVGVVYNMLGFQQWQSMIFTTLAFLQIFQALATRSNYDSLFSIGIFSNRVMCYIIGIMAVLQVAAIYTPLSVFLGLKELSPLDFLLSVALSAILLVVIEFVKLFKRRRAGLIPG
ncbi:MAG: cation-translocating P-type ATPase [Chloroflexi bacterium]|uniref:Cation-translocating P-type ATPase n=1 Tax=Candidatus Chlorohelix allophototropha TaxID=3003348 RepID=A0A8T7M0J8_9CHLR|nr:cation-translocating P-type ATPase [Chloroflexota bacterium]